MTTLDAMVNHLLSKRMSCRVRLTRYAMESGRKLKGNVQTGDLLKVSHIGGNTAFSVKVLPDGYKTPHTYLGELYI